MFKQAFQSKIFKDLFFLFSECLQHLNPFKNLGQLSFHLVHTNKHFYNLHCKQIFLKSERAFGYLEES